MYCEAAVAGSPEAAFRLGWMYANGRGVEHDDGTAVALFELAASEGHAFAKTLLQRMTGIPGHAARLHAAGGAARRSAGREAP